MMIIIKIMMKKFFLMKQMKYLGLLEKLKIYLFLLLLVLKKEILFHIFVVYVQLYILIIAKIFIHW